MTRSSDNWKARPGSFDALHADWIFPSDGNAWDIPLLRHAPISCTPAWMVPYRTRLRGANTSAGGAVHFFLDDYRFESVWSRPLKAFQAIQPFATVLTPDFSLFADYPLTLQLWNTYRSRWCGAYWQHLGFQVIPTVSWSTSASYLFCFAGVPQRSLVAVSTVGVRRQDYTLFAQGYRELLARLSPSRVLCYGSLAAELEPLADVCYYPPQAERLRNVGQRRASDRA